jgi:hypothetical protein
VGTKDEGIAIALVVRRSSFVVRQHCQRGAGALGEARALPALTQVERVIGLVEAREQRMALGVAVAVGLDGLEYGTHRLPEVEDRLVAQQQPQPAEWLRERHVAAQQRFVRALVSGGGQQHRAMELVDPG